MIVRVDQSWKHAEIRQVDHLGALWNRDVRPDLPNRRPFDQDDLVWRHRTGIGIDQPARTDRGKTALLSRLRFRGTAQKQEYKKQGDDCLVMELLLRDASE